MSSDACSIDQPNNEIPVEDMVMDFTHLFTTQEHFSSRDSLIQWTRAKGKEYGIVIVTGRSDKGWGNKTPRLFLTCERSGRHRGKKSVLQASCGMNEVDSVQQTEKQKGKRKRDTGTKKCGCPFRLKCKQINELGEWALEVMCGVHNHPIAKHMDGHSYVGRLLKPEEEYVTDISHANSKPKDILIALRRKFKDNKSTIRTIYHVRKKNKVNERDGRSQMQQLMKKLEEHGYYQHYRRCENTDTIKDLFFAHPGSIDLLHAFPYVIFMDCTYKTNRYKLPLLEIVGMTSTNLTFLIAVAYMEFEREDNYTWACTILRSLMDESLLPNVIVTDRELALMNAIKTIFPTSSHLLCRWHINKNILANCKKMFSKKERWDLFNMNWNMLVICNTEQDFKDMYTRLFDVFSDFPNALKYVNEQWLVPYKERFVSCWTNNIMHFDNTTTNRVETQHALLKRQLGSSQGNFETCWSQIHTLIEASHIAIKHSFEKSKNVVQFKFNSIIFKDLLGMVSTHALNLIFNVMNSLGKNVVDSLLCGCVERKSCGLPCPHEISEYMILESPIPLEEVHAFWRKLDFSSVSKDMIGLQHKQNIRFRECYANLCIKFERSSPLEKTLILKRFTELSTPTTTTVFEPHVKTKTRGRPKETKAKYDKSTKRNPSKFEYVESIKDSCLPVDLFAFQVGPTNESMMFSTAPRTKIQPVRQQTRFGTTAAFVNQLPSHLQSLVIEAINVPGDGHCGFRAIADLLGFGINSHGRIRRGLSHELIQYEELYKKVFIEHGRVEEVVNILNYYKEAAPQEHWFCLPEMGYLVASHYNVALVSLGLRLPLTFLPLRTPLPEEPKLICIGLINNDHFVKVNLLEGCPLPPVAALWNSEHHECSRKVRFS